MNALDRIEAVLNDNEYTEAKRLLLDRGYAAALIAVAEAAWEHLEYCDGSGYPIPDALAPLMKEAPDA